jgi:murein DD-endopeptidase MepM/ murein hydrolase activator NlpD
MTIEKNRRCGLARAGCVAILAGLVGACTGQSEPAPVYLSGAAEPVAAPLPTPAVQVIVRRGQSLGGLAHAYHVPKSAIIAANGLRPPYELREGSRLTIPASGALTQQAMRPLAAASVVPPATPLPPPRPLPPPFEAAVPQPPSSPQAIAPPLPSPAPPLSSGAQVIPLDGPSSRQSPAAPPPTASSGTLTPPQATPGTLAAPPAAPPQPGADPGKQAAGDTPAGRFRWPVRGRILAAYGHAASGGRNDGINIAAPLGTPVRAIDSGTVAYAGNEVKGYGNIVLIKHANGWISAYAHLDDVTVKPGETIAAGQVIAKVGNSGGVAEPQLHFELRRGSQPVDPREFLTPAPSAEGESRRAG